MRMALVAYSPGPLIRAILFRKGYPSDLRVLGFEGLGFSDLILEFRV